MEGDKLETGQEYEEMAFEPRKSVTRRRRDMQRRGQKNRNVDPGCATEGQVSKHHPVPGVIHLGPLTAYFQVVRIISFRFRSWSDSKLSTSLLACRYLKNNYTLLTLIFMSSEYRA